MSRRALVGLALVAAAMVGTAVGLATTAPEHPTYWTIFTHSLPPISFFTVGLILWVRRPSSPIGLLMFVAGVAWEIPWVGFIRSPIAFSTMTITASLYEVPLGHLAVAYPAGRLRSRFDRVIVVAIWSWWVANNFLFMFTWDPVADGATQPWQRNVLLITPSAGVQRVQSDLQFPVTAVLVTLVVSAVVRHWLQASPPGRRALRPAIAALVPVGGYVIMQELASNGLLPDSVIRWFFPWGPVVTAVLPVAMLVGLVRAKVSRGAVSDLVTELSEAPAPGRLREALARALGDPSVELAYPVGDEYVDVDGRPVSIPATGRAAMSLESGGQELALLVYDEELAEEPERVSGVSAAVRLALENERLQARVRAQLEEVRASRARILQAGDTERQRIERNLHDGAQQPLLTVSLALRMAESQVSAADPGAVETIRAAEEEVKLALAELRELAAGLHPMTLTRSGLGPAVKSLAERALVPVEVVEVPGARFPEDVEAAAYYVVSEALANTGKYAKATRASVRIARTNGVLRVEVADDGVGGADVSNGSGLTGLLDRVSVLGGRLSLTSPPGGGTSIVAEIPAP